MSDTAPPTGLDGWSDEASIAVLAAMSDVAARDSHADDTSERLVASAAEHLFGVDFDASERFLDRAEECAKVIGRMAEIEMELVLSPPTGGSA